MRPRESIWQPWKPSICTKPHRNLPPASKFGSAQLLRVPEEIPWRKSSSSCSSVRTGASGSTQGIQGQREQGNVPVWCLWVIPKLSCQGPNKEPQSRSILSPFHSVPPDLNVHPKDQHFPSQIQAGSSLASSVLTLPFSSVLIC